MDLTPPLTRSPASTPKTYCPSEASSSDYPSPELIEQHYSIPCAYDTGPPCSMAPSLNPNNSLSRHDNITQPEWKWNPTGVLHPSLTTSSSTHGLNAEYDPFPSYDNPFPGSYHSEVYTARSQHPPPTALPLSRSPVPQSSSRATMAYPPIHPASSSVAPRLKPEDMPTECTQDMESSRYPSPSIANAPYPADMHPNPSLPLPIQHTAEQSGSSYVSERVLTDWHKTEHYEPEPEHFYPGTGSHSPALLPMAHEARSMSQLANRPRRAPRKLTTKEEANFQCNAKGCGKLFSRSYNFKAHMETHREKREYPFPCQMPDCTKKFVRKTDLQRHHQSVHMKERNYKCDFCGRCFARRDTLGRYALIFPKPLP